VSFLFDVDEEIADEGYEGTITQALALMNGALTAAGVSAFPGTTVAEVMAMPLSDEARIEALYLRTLSRRPSAAELQRWLAFVSAEREVVDTGPPPKLPRLADAGKQARKAGADPTARLGARLKSQPTAREQAFEDLMWALVNSSEFQLRH
jgi:hypothetical protein